MKLIALILAVSLCLSGLMGCGMKRNDAKPSPSMNPSIIPSMTPDDGNVDDNGSEDGVLDTDKPETSDRPANGDGSDVSHPPQNSEHPEGEDNFTQPPVNSENPDGTQESPAVTDNAE